MVLPAGRLVLAERVEPEIAGLGGRIGARREEMKLTQPELARMADVNKSTLQAIEQGKIPNTGINNVLKIARALGMPIEELLFGRDLEASRAVAVYRWLSDEDKDLFVRLGHSIREFRQERKPTPMKRGTSIEDQDVDDGGRPRPHITEQQLQQGIRQGKLAAEPKDLSFDVEHEQAEQLDP